MTARARWTASRAIALGEELAHLTETCRCTAPWVHLSLEEGGCTLHCDNGCRLRYEGPPRPAPEAEP